MMVNPFSRLLQKHNALATAPILGQPPRLVYAALLCFAMLFVSSAYTQETLTPQQIPESGQLLTQQELEALSPAQLMIYLASQKEIVAGEGFINAQLGDEFAAIIRIWGPPRESRKTGILGSTEILYELDPSTLVVFTGNDTVRQISVQGRDSSFLRTRRGARFGMSPTDIRFIYADEESEAKRNRVEFDNLGISFHFVSNKVRMIVVYPAEN